MKRIADQLQVGDVIMPPPRELALWMVTADHAVEWHDGRKPYPLKFKVRPETPWDVVTLVQRRSFQRPNSGFNSRDGGHALYPNGYQD
jgi:hypothetical protein